MTDWSLDQWMKRYRVRSTILLATGIWMMIDAYKWGTNFASSSTRSGVEIAAIIAAVQGIATFYAGWAFKIYSESKIP